MISDMIEDESNKTENSAINFDEITRSRDPILNRFSVIFSKKVKLNPTYHAVYCMLQQGVDEYHIIEELLQKNEQLSNDIIKLNQKQVPKYYKDGRE
jgi:hypothetical protein